MHILLPLPDTWHHNSRQLCYCWHFKLVKTYLLNRGRSKLFFSIQIYIGLVKPSSCYNIQYMSQHRIKKHFHNFDMLLFSSFKMQFYTVICFEQFKETGSFRYQETEDSYCKNSKIIKIQDLQRTSHNLLTFLENIKDCPTILDLLT